MRRGVQSVGLIPTSRFPRPRQHVRLNPPHVFGIQEIVKRGHTEWLAKSAQHDVGKQLVYCGRGASEVRRGSRVHDVRPMAAHTVGGVEVSSRIDVGGRGRELKCWCLDWREWGLWAWEDESCVEVAETSAASVTPSNTRGAQGSGSEGAVPPRPPSATFETPGPTARRSLGRAARSRSHRSARPVTSLAP